MDRASLTADEMPCSDERKASLKCSQHLDQKDKAKHCQDFFDRYNECKKQWVEDRNKKNFVQPAQDKQKFPWSQ